MFYLGMDVAKYLPQIWQSLPVQKIPAALTAVSLLTYNGLSSFD